MSGPGDNETEMSPTWLLDDETIEAIVAGREVDARFDQIAAFARQVQALGDEPPPPASAALEAVFDGRRPRRGLVLHRGGLTTAAAKVAGLAVVVKIGLGTSVAAAGVVAAGAAGVLPDAATERVRGAIEKVTPVDFGGSGASDDPATGDDPGNPDRFGDGVSRDATGESDGVPGVDGGVISEEAPGATNRPADPGAARDRGIDRAGETPAAPQLPGEPGLSDGAPATPGATAPGATAPGATAPGATAPGRTRDPTATPPSTGSSPAATAPSTVPGRGNAGGGSTPTAQGG